MDPRVRDRIIAETRGNPLALLELPRAWTTAELTDGFEQSNLVPLASRIEQGFLRRVSTLPADSQRLLVAAAAEPLGDATLLWRAARVLGIGANSADPAETAGLIQFEGVGCASAIPWFGRPPTALRLLTSDRKYTGRSRTSPKPMSILTGALGIARRPHCCPTRGSLLSSNSRPREHNLAVACWQPQLCWSGRRVSHPTRLGAPNASWPRRGASAIAFNLTRAVGASASTFHARATTATIRRHLIAVPTRLASSARRLTLHLPRDWPWQAAWNELFTTACGPPPIATT